VEVGTAHAHRAGQFGNTELFVLKVVLYEVFNLTQEMFLSGNMG